MRPLELPRWDPSWAGYGAGTVAVAATGKYCVTCERVLYRPAVAWDAMRGEEVGRVATAAAWTNLLALCEHCAAAAARMSPRSWGEPLLPHRDETFGLGDDSPFGYEMRPVEIVAPELGVSSPREVERVVVVPRVRRAEDTVGLFALNEAVVPDPDSQPPEDERVEAPDELAVGLIEFHDPRLKLRTEAWLHAHESAALLAEAATVADRGELGQMLAHAVTAGGFWSVWATVLWERLGDLALMQSVFAPGAPVLEGEALSPYRPAPPSARSFPSTRGGWLARAAGPEATG